MVCPSLWCWFGFPGGSDGKEFACSAGDLGSIPGLGRSPGEGNSYSLQYSGLEKSIDRGAWQAIYSPRNRRFGGDFHFRAECRGHAQDPVFAPHPLFFSWPFKSGSWVLGLLVSCWV